MITLVFRSKTEPRDYMVHAAALSGAPFRVVGNSAGFRHVAIDLRPLAYWNGRYQYELFLDSDGEFERSVVLLNVEKFLSDEGIAASLLSADARPPDLGTW